MSSSKTILLVEDNPDDVFIFKHALKGARITNPMTVVTNGQEAVDYLCARGRFADREKHPLPFLLFLDLKLPYLDGFEVLSWIRQQPALRSMPVVVLSGSDEPMDLQRVTTLGARSYMVKPPEPDALRQFMDALIANANKARGRA